MDGWRRNSEDTHNNVLRIWYRRVRESNVVAWFFSVFQRYGMSTSSTTIDGAGSCSGVGGGAVGSAFSLMGCVREASPPPQNHRFYHHYCHQHRALPLSELTTQNSTEPTPKEPKKRRFHPLRGLRKIFRRKSRGAADVRLPSGPSTKSRDYSSSASEDAALRHLERPEETRSRSASELLTDSYDHDGIFLKRSGTEDLFMKLRGGAGKLSVSHDSVFPGEVPSTRPLSSLDTLTALERRQERTSNETETKDYTQYAAHRHLISVRVLEQIKTVIENRNQLASTTVVDASNNVATIGEHYQQETIENQFHCFGSHEKNVNDSLIGVTRHTNDADQHVATKEDLPELETDSLNHTAAHHRISVRPKNRRPPRRMILPLNNNAPIPAFTAIAENTMDSLEPEAFDSNMTSSPTVAKKVSIMRKTSSRLSRTSDIYEELESKMSRKPSASVTSLSPDSLDTTTISRSSIEGSEEQLEFKSIARKSSNQITKDSDIFDELQIKLPQRRPSANRLSKSPDSLETSSGFFSKSMEGFDKLTENEELKPITKTLLNAVSKSTDQVCKSSDSLEAIEALANDDCMDRRRSNLEFNVRLSSKIISKSTESFDILEREQSQSQMRELQSSISDFSLSRRRRLSKTVTKSSESFEGIQMNESKDKEFDEESLRKNSNYRFKRISSESSDNVEPGDKLENTEGRNPVKRKSIKSAVEIASSNEYEEGRRPMPMRKPLRLQKSSESSELGSTDTLDSDKRNKSSESCDTLDSLERDLEQDRKEEEMIEKVDRREKSGSWSNRSMAATDSDHTSIADGTDDTDRYIWRQSSETKENIDIHQLLAITIVTRVTDNGNSQRNSVIYSKNKHESTNSPPTSPAVKQEDSKLLFDNLLVSRDDEDLQNMLNGNISEVSNDTKSFKEKLIMFEKLGK